MAAGVKIELAGIKHLKQRVRKGGSISLAGGPVDDMFRGWGEKYLGFVDRRFDKFSKGGGDWDKLTKETVRRRRRGGKRRGGVNRIKARAKKTGGKVAILADTGILKGGLTVGAAGNLFRRTRKGIRVGFGGLSRHAGDPLTIRELAIVHDQGVPSRGIPQRQILVKPDTRLKRRLNADLKKMIRLIGREAQRKL